MARRKQKKTRRRDKAISLSGLAESLMLANVGTQAAFNLNAWDWITDGWTTGTAGRATGSGQVSLHELIYGNFSKAGSLGFTPAGGSYQGAGTTYAMTQSAGDIAMQNLKANWAPALIQTFAIPVGFKLGRKALSRPIRMGNKLLKQIGLRGQVKI
jgi:hypothetical protein